MKEIKSVTTILHGATSSDMLVAVANQVSRHKTVNSTTNTLMDRAQLRNLSLKCYKILVCIPMRNTQFSLVLSGLIRSSSLKTLLQEESLMSNFVTQEILKCSCKYKSC